ncbi:MAG: response regulator [Sinimarinibacterium flocculans]|uniref:LuxR family two component transcriptional regulator n=1 Tax=Sinimarinibacterium flocculans TaxID=985250 RepID=A0A318EJC9_9GAMM|nr:response regulator transcription factor [Sinimarinibacterium flocculans]MEC9361884.1 response regulator transcription factor [Pseudomonadota bacterium]PXV70994.1 LuxR family two component transcriptional regulator [Sinimarinibacterium flocculans]
MKRIERALVVEDVTSAAAWLSGLLQDVFACDIYVAASVQEGRRKMTMYGPDLVLVDLGLPDGSGVELLRYAAQNFPDCLRVVTTIYADDEHLFAALRAGVQGYLLKDEPDTKVRRALKSIADGEPPLSSLVAQRMLTAFGPTEAQQDAMSEEGVLSPREREVLTLIAKGMRMPEVADMLGITRNTTAGYIKSVYRKLGVSTRAEAALKAANLGLV